MKLKTKVKTYLLVTVCCIAAIFVVPGFLYCLSGPYDPSGGIAAVVFGILFFGIFGTPFWISIRSDGRKEAEEVLLAKKNESLVSANTDRSISLRRKILNIVARQQKPLSVYDFMIGIKESEDVIEEELEKFVGKGVARKLVNERGLTLYEFELLLDESQRKDILE